MNSYGSLVQLFTMPLQFPCGPQSSCCGPVGQSDEEIEQLKEAIERELGVRVEIKNVLKGEDMRNFREVSALFRSFGPMALPIIVLNDEIISMGNPTPGEAIRALKSKLQQA